MENITKVLSMMQLDCIQEVNVNCSWHLSTLAMFAPFLGQVSHLQRFHLFPIHMSVCEKQEQYHFVLSEDTSEYHLSVPEAGPPPGSPSGVSLLP